MKYRLKPLDVNAIQWTGDNISDVFKFLGTEFYGDVETHKEYIKTNELSIYIQNTIVPVQIGEYIVKTKDFKFDTYTADEFEKFYEPVKNSDKATQGVVKDMYLIGPNTCTIRVAYNNGDFWKTGDKLEFVDYNINPNHPRKKTLTIKSVTWEDSKVRECSYLCEANFPVLKIDKDTTLYLLTT